MSYSFDQKAVQAAKVDIEPATKPTPEQQWRQFDFGMDCLIPAEDYALPKGHEHSRG